MTITYVTDGAWGSGTGVPHGAAEADGIIYDLDQRLQYLLDNPAAPLSITYLSQSGTVVTFYRSDAVAVGSVNLPQAEFRPSIVSTISADTDNTFTPTDDDANCYKVVTDADGLTVYLTSDVTKDTEFTFDLAVGSATVDFVAGDTDADLLTPYGPPAGFLAQMSTVGAVVTAKALGSGKWRLIGLLDEDVTA